MEGMRGGGGVDVEKDSIDWLAMMRGREGGGGREQTLIERKRKES